MAGATWGSDAWSGAGFSLWNETHRGLLCDQAELGGIERVRLGHRAVGAFKAITDQFAEKWETYETGDAEVLFAPTVHKIDMIAHGFACSENDFAWTNDGTGFGR